jgi:DNA-directed RNA polymerase specialized sigma24 family protein
MPWQFISRESRRMPREDAGSVARWSAGLTAGDRAVVQPLWDRYFAQLVRLARCKLRAAHRAVDDEEDAALSAFESFCAGAECGLFTDLADRDDLWHLLVVITARKARDHMKRDSRQKRGGGRVVRESELAAAAPVADIVGLDQIVGSEPTPEFAAMAVEEYKRLLGVLGDESLRQVALWRLEGYTTDEMAKRLGCARRTVARRLELIRTLWIAEVA